MVCLLKFGCYSGFYSFQSSTQCGEYFVYIYSYLQARKIQMPFFTYMFVFNFLGSERVQHPTEERGEAGGGEEEEAEHARGQDPHLRIVVVR